MACVVRREPAKKYRLSTCLAVALLGLGTSCVFDGDCYVSEESWLHHVTPSRNADGVPTIEVGAARWTEPACAAGRRVWIELSDDIVIREPRPEEILQGPAPISLGNGRFGYERIVVGLSWDPSRVQLDVTGETSTTTIECAGAPAGLPTCAPM